jgi:hypothetical protein
MKTFRSLLAAALLPMMLWAGSASAQQSAQDMYRRIQDAAASRHSGDTDEELRAKIDKEAIVVKIKNPIKVDKNMMPTALPGLENEPYKVGIIARMITPARIVQVMEDDCLVIKRYDSNLILRGVETEGLADGQYIKVSAPVKITGTESFKTVLGARKTLFVLEPVMIRVDPVAEKARRERLAAEEKARTERLAVEEKARTERLAVEEKAKEAAKAADEAARWRTWTQSGEQFEARFGGLVAGKVRLVKKDGTTIRVPLDELSDEDREWIQNRKR